MNLGLTHVMTSITVPLKCFATVVIVIIRVNIGFTIWVKKKM
jgi:hypothetical protein